MSGVLWRDGRWRMHGRPPVEVVALWTPPTAANAGVLGESPTGVHRRSMSFDDIEEAVTERMRSSSPKRPFSAPRVRGAAETNDAVVLLTDALRDAEAM